MPVLEFGQTLATSELQNFRPVVGVPSYISILKHDSVIANEVFWAPKDIGLDIFGPFQSDSLLAKKAFGSPSVYYTFPIFVHNSLQDAGGVMMIWRVTKTVYNLIVETAAVADLDKFSLQISTQKQGQGTRTSITPIPSPLLRDYWPPEFKQQIVDSVNYWFEVSQTSLYRNISENELISELQQVGYDFNTNTFPNRLMQQSSYFSQKQISAGVSSLSPAINTQAPTPHFQQPKTQFAIQAPGPVLQRQPQFSTQPVQQPVQQPVNTTPPTEELTPEQIDSLFD